MADLSEPGTAESLKDWRNAERALDKAKAGREAAEEAAVAAEKAERSAAATAEASRAALAAATLAEKTAMETAEAARATSAATSGDVIQRRQNEVSAEAHEQAAKERYQQAEDRARGRPGGG